MRSVTISSLPNSTKKLLMTDELFFDTDCLSSFLWTDEGCILTKLYPGKIAVPQAVFNELSRVHKPIFKERLDTLLESGEAIVVDIEAGSDASKLYRRMTQKPLPGFKVVGKGEAASLALAKEHSGIVASNNFRDIRQYVQEFNLRYKSTGDIMVEAYEQGLISEFEGNNIWRQMLEEDCWIGADSFTEYLKKPYKPLSSSL